MNKNFIRLVLREIINTFSITKNSIRKRREIHIVDYFKIIADDLNCSFQKIRSDKK